MKETKVVLIDDLKSYEPELEEALLTLARKQKKINKSMKEIIMIHNKKTAMKRR